MRRTLGGLILVAAAAVMLLGRHGQDTPTSPVVVANGGSGTAIASAPTPPGGPPSTSSSAPGSLATPEAQPVHPPAALAPLDPQQTAGFATYARAAEAFMADFARPSSAMTEQQWWAKVAPHLTDAAAAAYEGTDPQNVPFTKVTGPPIVLLTDTPPDPLTDAPNDLLLLARVPTDAGWFRVEMCTVPEGIRITRATPERGT